MSSSFNGNETPDDNANTSKAMDHVPATEQQINAPQGEPSVPAAPPNIPQANPGPAPHALPAIEPNAYKCRFCPRLLKTSGGLSSHERACEKRIAQASASSPAPAPTPAQAQAQAHAQASIPAQAVPKPQWLTCPEQDCLQVFEGRSLWIAHLDAEHADVRPWKCTGCGYRFVERRGWEHHVQGNLCGQAF